MESEGRLFRILLGVWIHPGFAIIWVKWGMRDTEGYGNFNFILVLQIYYTSCFAPLLAIFNVPPQHNIQSDLRSNIYLGQYYIILQDAPL